MPVWPWLGIIRKIIRKNIWRIFHFFVIFLILLILTYAKMMPESFKNNGESIPEQFWKRKKCPKTILNRSLMGPWLMPDRFLIDFKLTRNRSKNIDFGSWILDFGFWILTFWLFDFLILDFGFWILDFGFWILYCGFWIFGFCIFGFCIFGFCDVVLLCCAAVNPQIYLNK